MGGKIHLFINTALTECMIRLDTTFCDVFEEDVLKALSEKGIVHGIVKGNFDKFLNDTYDHREKLLIAKATPPGTGKDGYLEFLISSAINIKENKFGKVDFYDIGLIKTVQANERLVKIYPPIVGTEGCNLMGEKIPGILGKPAEVNRIKGEGVGIDETGNYLIALKNGCYKKKYGLITVLEELRIERNLDFAVGNVDTTASIVVNGDIKSGFTCKTSSDMIVSGVIEDAKIEIRDNLICKSGIAKGSNLIAVGKSLRVRYIMMRSNVKAENIHVETTVFDSEVNAISLLEARKLCGGRTKVRQEMVVEELGNENFVKTYVEIGLNQDDIYQMSQYYAEMKKLEKDIKGLQNEVETREYLLKEFVDERGLILQNTKSPILIEKYETEKAKKETAVEKVREDVAKIQAIYDNINKRYSELKSIKDSPTCKIIVKDQVFPNVTIILNTYLKYEVKNRMREVVFKVNRQGELKPFQLKAKDGEEKEL